MLFGVGVALVLQLMVLRPEKAARAPLQISAVGDIIFGRFTTHGYRSLVLDDVFSAVAVPLRADLVLGNLETPVVEVLPERSPLRRGYRFGAKPYVADLMRDAGFTALSIANNHAVDLVADGLTETAEHVAAAGIGVLGRPSADGTPTIDTLEIHGWRVAVIAATTWLNAPVPSGAPSPPLVSSKRLARILSPLVSDAAENHDLVIVSLHWGREYTEIPENRQRHVARVLAEAGADFIWGHHAHLLQGVEWIGDTLVAYSLGNFVFYEGRESGSRNSAILRLTRSVAGRWTDAHLVPIRIEGSRTLRPRPANLVEARRIRRGLRRTSGRLGTRTEVAEDGTLRIMLKRWTPSTQTPRAAAAASQVK
ncbi:MAG: CapA family protein [Nannocystaceae bacterium]|nr:CapA family protein [Nannocystaceae bacterium]